MNPSSDPEEKQSDLQKNLEEISLLLKKIEVHRRRQVIWSLIGLAALLLIAAAFFANLYLIGKKFDIERLAEEMIGKSDQVLDSRAVQQLRQDFHRVFLPACQEELAKEFEKRLPELRGVMETQTRETEDFLQNDLRPRLNRRLHESFGKAEAEIAKKYADSMPAGISAADGMRAFEMVFADDVAGELNRNVENSRLLLRNLRTEALAFRQLPEYKTLQQKSVPEVESLLFETFLELWIYYLNPARGAVAGGL